MHAIVHGKEHCLASRHVHHQAHNDAARYKIDKNACHHWAHSGVVRLQMKRGRLKRALSSVNQAGSIPSNTGSLLLMVGQAIALQEMKFMVHCEGHDNGSKKHRQLSVLLLILLPC